MYFDLISLSLCLSISPAVILGAFSLYAFRLSSDLKAFWTILASAGSLDAFDLSCVTASSTEQKIVRKVLSILILWAALLAVVLIRVLLAWCFKSNRNWFEFREFENQLLHLSLPRAMTFCYTLGAMNVAVGSFAIHDCQQVGHDWYLSADTAIRCDGTDAVYSRLMRWSIFGTVQLACLPALVLFVDVAKRYCPPNEPAGEPQPGEPQSGEPGEPQPSLWDFLREGYLSHASWYYCPALIRKYLFVLVPMVVQDASRQTVYANLIILASLLLCAVTSPYASAGANVMEMVSLSVISVTLVIASAFFSSSPAAEVGSVEHNAQVGLVLTMLTAVIICYVMLLFFHTKDDCMNVGRRLRRGSQSSPRERWPSLHRVSSASQAQHCEDEEIEIRMEEFPLHAAQSEPEEPDPDQDPDQEDGVPTAQWAEYALASWSEALRSRAISTLLDDGFTDTTELNTMNGDEFHRVCKLLSLKPGSAAEMLFAIRMGMKPILWDRKRR